MTRSPDLLHQTCVAKRMPSRSQLSLFQQRASVADCRPKTKDSLMKQLNIIKKIQKCNHQSFAFLCDFYTKVNPVFYSSNFIDLQFVFISTYHHCMYYVIFRLLMHLFKIIPFDWASTTSMWFCLILKVWESIYFVISYYRIGVGIFCKVCYSVWTRFIILHIIKATHACFIKKYLNYAPLEKPNSTAY